MTDTTTMADAGAAAENLAPDLATQTPAPATLESDAAQKHANPATPDRGDDADKSVKRLMRRVDRVTAARYQAEARADQLAAKLAEYERAAQPQAEPVAVKPEDIDRIATERAREMATAASVAERSNQAFSAGVKSFGEEAFRASLAAVIDEAGPIIGAKGMPTALGEAILDADDPAKLLHHLGQHPDIADSLRDLSPSRLGRRIASIEADMKAAAPAPSRAPKPLEPVKAVATNAGPSPESSDYMTWKLSKLRGR